MVTCLEFKAEDGSETIRKAVAEANQKLVWVTHSEEGFFSGIKDSCTKGDSFLIYARGGVKLLSYGGIKKLTIFEDYILPDILK